MKIMPYKSFKFRLHFFLVLLFVNVLLVFAVFIWYNQKTAAINQISSQLASLNLSVKSITIKEKDFLLYAPTDSIFFRDDYSIHIKERDLYVNQYHRIIAKIGSDKQRMKNSITFSRIQETINEKNSIFDTLYVKLKQKGFGKYGLFGDLNSTINEFKNIAPPAVADRFDLLRKHEKNYLLTKHLSHTTKFNAGIKELETYIVKLNRPNKKMLIERLQQYKTCFAKIVLLDIQIGNSGSSGLISDVFWLSKNIDSYVTQLNHDLNKQVKRIRQRTYLLFLFVLLTTATIILLFGVFVYRRLAKPIAVLSETIKHIAENNFLDTKLNVGHKHSDEIGQLYDTIQTMLLKLDDYVNRINMQKTHLVEINDDLRQRSEEVEAQAEMLQKINKRLKKSNKTINDLYHEQSSLIHIVAHDLKSPLTNISQMLQLIEMQTEKTETTNSMFEMAHKVISDGFEFIQDLLDAHAVEFKRENLNIQEFDAVSFVEKVVNTHRNNAEKKNILLEYNTADDKLMLKSSKNYLMRILDNLISNAIKFSPNDKQVIVSVNSRVDNVIFTVKDYGQGFTEDDKRNAFKKFQRLSAKPTAGEHSSGLGLSIVKTLVNRLNGNIQLISEAGKGSEFIIEIPKS